MTPATNAFSKKVENHKAAVALHFMWYSFGRIHRSLRVTPAMEAGVSDHVWPLLRLRGVDMGNVFRESPAQRPQLLRRGILLEAATVGWNVIEGVIAVGAGLLASSVALIGFGIDSFVETTSGAVVGWRLRAELVGRLDDERAEALERRAGRIAGALLLGLALYIIVDAGRRLLGFGAEAQESRLGMVVTAISLMVMPALGWAKLRTATALRSGALRADAYETITCSWLSLTTLAGLILNAALGWWWADPLAALAIVPLAVREGLEGCRGECHEAN